MTEFTYKGVRIVQEKQRQLGNPSMNPLGFKVEHQYLTLDDFDDHALAVCYHQFWSPVDACMAVDINQWTSSTYGPKAGSWRFSHALAMRAKPWVVRDALLDIRDLIDEGDVYSAKPGEIADAVLDCIRKLELDIR